MPGVPCCVVYIVNVINDVIDFCEDFQLMISIL